MTLVGLVGLAGNFFLNNLLESLEVFVGFSKGSPIALDAKER
jgi:hypothetical protein